MTAAATVDHLVVVAATLDDGVAWCERTLGITPGTGGAHPLMGTHNRLLRLGSGEHPRAYFEIIAIDPAVQPQRAGPRWFDMDDPQLRAAVAQQPRLAHFVAAVPDVGAGVAALRALGIERGEVVRASRMTPGGLLEWQITVRPDGRRLFDGTLPTLIEWGGTHPSQAMADCGLSLQSLAVSHPQHAELAQAYDAIGLRGIAVTPGAARLRATLRTPRGTVVLESA